MLREIVSQDWFTIMILVSIAMVASSKLAFPARFMDFTTLIGNSKYLKIYSRDQKFVDLFDGLLFLNLVISLSVFIQIAVTRLAGTDMMGIDSFSKLAVGLGTLFMIKILVERLIGSLFEIDAIIDFYLFQKISYRNFLGFMLVPMNALLLFALKPSPTIIYIFIFMLLVLNVIGIVTSIKNNQKLILGNFFYFILYLCALEISPYVILYKVFIID